MPQTPPQPPQHQRRRARRRGRLLLLGAGLVVALLLGEAALRLAGGYRLLPVRLRHGPGPSTDAAAQLAALRETVDPFVAGWQRRRPDLDPAWLATSPPPLPPQPPLDAKDEVLPQVQWLTHYYVLNEVLLRAMWVRGQGLPMFPGLELPASFTVFPPPGGRPEPRFRYPVSRSLPTGLTTNAFGFRGRQLTVDKPPRTVRIGFVGASTTVEAARLPHSAPELIEHWLSLWAAARGLAVRFETLNAAREAVLSPDLRAIAIDELLPLAVDYVVYYEGANQLQPATMQRHVRVEGDYRLAEPPPGLVGTFGAEAGTGEPTWLDRLAAHSAIVRFARTALAGREPLREPDKPPQRVELPQGLAAEPFPLLRAGEALELGAIARDLDAIDAAARAARARLVLCTFAWLAHEGLRLDPVLGHNVHVQLNRAYWPFRYSTVRALADLQNRFFAAWAAARGVDLIDVAAGLPAEPCLYIDAIHHTEPGVRLKAWVLFAALTAILARDLEAGTVPVPDEHPDARHPHVGIERELTRAELDG